jgi:uncharacterized protein (DUF58 family)
VNTTSVAKLKALQERWRARALGRMTSRPDADNGVIELGSRRCYILPTRAGLVFALMVFAIWFTSLNFNLQLGYALSYLCVSIGLIAMLETHRNLVNLRLRELHCEASYAGSAAQFDFALENTQARARPAIHLGFVLPHRRRDDTGADRGLQGVWLDLPASASVTASIGLPTRRRGPRASPRVRVSTRFPLGLWEAWAYLAPQMRTMVYPAPTRHGYALPSPQAIPGNASGPSLRLGTEDFAGVRPYQRGDALRSVAWRLAARSDDLSVKTFESPQADELRIDFADLPATMQTEQRLSQLVAWILEADAKGLRYGLRLPGVDVAAGGGPDHRRFCLEHLALFPA